MMKKKRKLSSKKTRTENFCSKQVEALKCLKTTNSNDDDINSSSCSPSSPHEPIAGFSKANPKHAKAIGE